VAQSFKSLCLVRKRSQA